MRGSQRSLPNLMTVGTTILLLAACDSPTGSEPPRPCTQTDLAPNTGCARVLANIAPQGPGQAPAAGGEGWLGFAGYPPEKQCCERASTPVEEDGSFVLTLHRFEPTPGDTATVFIGAAFAVFPGAPITQDSVPVVLSFTPIGEVPDLVEISVPVIFE